MRRMWGVFGRDRAAACATCGHFVRHHAGLEGAVPNLAVLSSAYAAVTGGDGLCRLHDTFQSPRSRCRDHITPVPARP